MKKLLTMLLAITLILGLAAPALGAGPTDPKDPFAYNDADMDAETQGKPKLHKYLVMDAAANVPEVTFQYSIDAGTAIAATETTLPVYAGPDGATVGSVSFANADTTTGGLPEDATKTEYKYVDKPIQLDFSGVQFTKPGVYRYILTETTPATPDVFLYDTNAEHADRGTTTSYKRTIDVYVEDNAANATTKYIYGTDEYDTEAAAKAAVDAANVVTQNTSGEWEYAGTTYDTQDDAKAAAYADLITPPVSSLKVVGYVCYEGTVATAPAKTYNPSSSTAAATGGYVLGSASGSRIDGQTKSDNYVNEYQTVDLQVTKTIAGNQGDKTDKFYVTITITNLPEGTKLNWYKGLEYTSDIDPADPATYDSTDTWSATASTTSTGTYEIVQTVEVTHLDKYLITGIPYDAAYVVQELDKKNGNALGDNATTKDGYTVTYDGNGDGGSGSTKNKYEDAKVGEATEPHLYTVDITNTRTGLIPTGVLMSVGGGVALVAIAGAALIALNRKKRDDE